MSRKRNSNADTVISTDKMFWLVESHTSMTPDARRAMDTIVKILAPPPPADAEKATTGGAR